MRKILENEIFKRKNNIYMKKLVLIALVLIPSLSFGAGIDYFIIGGGGGAGCVNPNTGGSAGGYVYDTNVTTFSVGTYAVIVGEKGPQDCGVGLNGEDSSFNGKTGVGGIRGTGGSSDGGDGIGTNNVGCNGGNGLEFSISTTTRYYGGAGQGYNSGSCGTNGLGYDWYGGGADATVGVSQKDGVVVIKYLSSDYEATGGTEVISGDYTIHVFETSGNFEITACASCEEPTQQATSTPMTYEENLLIACLLIFFITIPMWNFIFSPSKQIQ